MNPRGLHGTIKGNVVQGVSRTLFEEVRVRMRRLPLSAERVKAALA